MRDFDMRRLSRLRAARSRVPVNRPLPVSNMSSLAIVRGLVKRLMKIDTDDPELRKGKPEILKWKMPTIRNYPDDDDDDPERI
jgi:hypothetical protein